MTKNGLCNLGTDYIPKVERLRSILGIRKDTDAVRAVIDAVLEDADESDISEVPRRALGLKPFTKSTKPISRRKAQTK